MTDPRQALRPARWHRHINHVRAPELLKPWLTDTGSLTARLVAHSLSFQVQKLSQRHSMCWEEEASMLGLTRRRATQTREVLLCCDGRPVVFAHTVMGGERQAGQWPQFRGLANRSLGSTLFSDPLVRRGTMQCARLRPSHPAMQSAHRATGIAECATHTLFARRSLFYRRSAVLLVTELFLPAALELKLAAVLPINNDC